MKRHGLASSLRCLSLIAGCCLIAASPAEAALTVQTSDFLAGVTNYNGFEGLPATGSHDGSIPYTEDGITVEYLGSDTGIWTTHKPAEGVRSWYNNGGAFGYTRITFDQDISALEFQAANGFNTTSTLYYDVLLDGVSIGSGSYFGVPGSGSSFFGFSGALFDEVLLQVRDGNPGGAFDPGAFEAGDFDAFNFGGTSVVPEPGTWAMMLIGFGAVGFAMRRRRPVVSAQIFLTREVS